MRHFKITFFVTPFYLCVLHIYHVTRVATLSVRILPIPLCRLCCGGQSACMWLAGAMQLSTVHSNLLLYILLFCETLDLVWERKSISEKRMKNCVVKVFDNVFKKMMKVGYFLSMPYPYHLPPTTYKNVHIVAILQGNRVPGSLG